MPYTEPYSQVYDRIWEILTTRTAWSALVKPGNRINFSGDDADPTKQQIAEGDLPQATLVQGGFIDGGFTSGTNRCAQFDQTFELQLLARDLRIDLINQLKFQTQAALHNAGVHLGLTDASAAQAGPFVENWRIQGSDTPDTPGNSGKLVWRTVLSITVTMAWPRGAFAE